MTRTLFGALALAALAGSASAEITVENAAYGGAAVVNMGDGSLSTRVGTTVYSNISSAANVATSSATTGTVWGDSLNMTGTGLLEEFTFGIYNSSSSTSTLTAVTYSINFYKQSDSSFIGGFSTGSLNMVTIFGSPGLQAGFFGLVTFTGMGFLGINLNDPNIICTQNITAKTGSTRMGVVSLNPVTVGSSGVDFYKNDSAAPPAGWYVFSGGATPAQIAYGINVTPAPSAMALMGLGGLIAGRRRR